MTDVKTPTTELELNSMIGEAINSGDTVELDRLMAVELPEVAEVQEEPEEAEALASPAEGDKPDEDGTSVEVKEEAAPEVKESAASTPEVVKTQENEADTLRRELHKLKSDVGRVPFMQSRMKELERELREVKLSRNVGVDPADPSKTVEVPADIKKRIDELREVDPSLATLLEDMAKALRSETQSTARHVVSSINESEREVEERRTVQEQYEQLLEEVPWAPQAFQSQEWKQWKDSLLPGQRAMAESTYAGDVKVALNEFARVMQARQGSATSVQQVPPAVVVDEEAEKVKRERERKLATGSTSKSPTAKQGSPVLDEDAAFAEFYAQIQKENHLR